VGINHLSADKFSRVPVLLPPLAEQHRIVADVDRRLSITAEAETQVNANLQRADRLRQSILSRAFSGELISEHRVAPASGTQLDLPMAAEPRPAYQR
jgi:type I restriction enzyme, S subunit